MTTIDLNADLGEGGAFDVELMQIVSSCNIACGGHAGDHASITQTVRLAVENNVAIGAHPAYPDRAGFGRSSTVVAGDDLLKSLINQLDSLKAVAREAGRLVAHVKPHGALYNDSAADRGLAEKVVHASQSSLPDAAIVGPPNSALQVAADALGLRFIGEAFVDRAYLPDGSLVPRSEPNAVHGEQNTITRQAVGLALHNAVTAENGELIEIRASTLCIHGDTENAAEVGRAVRDVLLASGVQIRAAS